MSIVLNFFVNIFGSFKKIIFDLPEVVGDGEYDLGEEDQGGGCHNNDEGLTCEQGKEKTSRHLAIHHLNANSKGLF